MDNEFYRDYRERVMPALQKAHGYQNVLQIPKVEKVVINTSVGSQSDVKQALEEAKAELALITGQRPVETLAKKSISNFKLRKSQAIGAKVTLRGERMYEFLERFIKAALPRIRDFRGVSPSCFDKHGNDTSAAHPRIKITNKFVNRASAIMGLRRVSRPGLRRYVGADEIPRVLGGMGLAILSTSRGVLSGREARKQKIGGELLAYVW